MECLRYSLYVYVVGKACTKSWQWTGENGCRFHNTPNLVVSTASFGPPFFLFNVPRQMRSLLVFLLHRSKPILISPLFDEWRIWHGSLCINLLRPILALAVQPLRNLHFAKYIAILVKLFTHTLTPKEPRMIHYLYGSHYGWLSYE